MDEVGVLVISIHVTLPPGDGERIRDRQIHIYRALCTEDEAIEEARRFFDINKAAEQLGARATWTRTTPIRWR